jgi:peptidoglycan/xylan/chitin deacetylase (PgdA/CDA1 family)
MRFVSSLLKYAVYPALHYTGVLDRILPSSGYTVVTYHGVVPADYTGGDPFLDGSLVRPEIFRQQLQFLKAHYNVVHPDEFRAWIEDGGKLPSRAVLLTCDDGLANTLTDMLPVLQSESVPCLFFVTTASCCDHPGTLWYDELYLLMRLRPLTAPDLQLPSDEDSDSTPAKSFAAQWWDTVKRASRLEASARAQWMDRVRIHCNPTHDFRTEHRWQLLNVSGLRQMADSGMSIGGHTRSHPILSLCSDEEARREVQASKTEMEQALARPVWAFAYPFGHPSTVGEREVMLARETAFACAFVNVEHWKEVNGFNPFAIPRLHVTSQMALPEFAAHLSSVHVRLERALRS